MTTKPTPPLTEIDAAISAISARLMAEHGNIRPADLRSAVREQLAGADPKVIEDAIARILAPPTAKD